MDFRQRPKRRRLLRTAVASVALLALLSGTSIAADSEEDPQMAAIRSRLDKANAQTAQLLNELKALDVRIFKVTRQIQQEESEVTSLQSKLRNSQQQSVETGARLESVKVARNDRVRRVYKDGPATILAALFGVRSHADLLKFWVFFKSALDQDARIIVESTELINKLEAEKSTLAELSETVARRTQGLKNDKETLKSSRSQRSASLGKVRQSIVEAMAAEKALLAARAAAEAAKAAAAKAAATQVRPSPKPCVPGNPVKDRRLAALLDWYAPAAGNEPFMPQKLSSTDVVFNGVTSWYGPGFEGCATASGATFRSEQMTAASLSLPLGTLLKVTKGGRAVVVVITDRGPYIQGRDLDLSKGAAAAIGALGIGSVRMEVVLPNEPAPPFP